MNHVVGVGSVKGVGGGLFSRPKNHSKVCLIQHTARLCFGRDSSREAGYVWVPSEDGPAGPFPKHMWVIMTDGALDRGWGGGWCRSVMRGCRGLASNVALNGFGVTNSDLGLCFSDNTSALTVQPPPCNRFLSDSVLNGLISAWIQRADPCLSSDITTYNRSPK